MARLFNGTSDLATATPDFSGQQRVMVSAWLYRDDTSANRIVFEYGSANGFDVVANAFAGADLIRSYGAGAVTWADSYPTPTLNTWHHYLWLFYSGNGGAGFNRCFIDGIDQAMTNRGHTAGAYTWANNRLDLGARGPAAGSLFLSCRIAEFTVWNGVASTAISGPPKDTAAGLFAGGWSAPHLFGGPGFYLPFFGVDSPEPEYMVRKNATLTGTSYTNHPRVRSMLMPGAS